MRATKSVRDWAEKQAQHHTSLPGLLTAPLARLATITALLGALAWPPQVEATAVHNQAAYTAAHTSVPKRLPVSQATKDLIFVKSLGFDNVDKYVVYKASGVRVPDKLPVDHFNYMLQAASKHGIPKKIMFRLIAVESEFNKNATSQCGASGYMQLMPSTQRELMKNYGIKRGDMPKHKLNIFLGAAYLKDLFRYTRKHVDNDKGAWRIALACYNAGPDNVHGFRVPSYCKAYVNKITRKTYDAGPNERN